MQKELVRIRSFVVKTIRQFFDEQGFVEMLTPRLVGFPGQEPHLEPISSTVHEQGWKKDDKKMAYKKHKAALITSPEYSMKKMLAAGFERIYDLGPCFRDQEPWDGTHDPEFLLLEWYRRDTGLDELMKDTEELIRFVVKKFEAALPSGVIRLSQRLIHLRQKISYVRPAFRRLTVAEALKQYADIDLESLLDNRAALANVAREHGQKVAGDDHWDDLFFKIFLSEVEPKIGWSADGQTCQPTFLWNYPLCMAGLARTNEQDPRFALRTELYIGPYELGNGFAELCDTEEQRRRFVEEQSLRHQIGKKVWPIDERFLSQLPNVGNAVGMAFGVERLAMLLTDTVSISDLMPISVRERF